MTGQLVSIDMLVSGHVARHVYSAADRRLSEKFCFFNKEYYYRKANATQLRLTRLEIEVV
jgi:hypothetical protein